MTEPHNSTIESGDTAPISFEKSNKAGIVAGIGISTQGSSISPDSWQQRFDNDLPRIEDVCKGEIDSTWYLNRLKSFIFQELDKAFEEGRQEGFWKGEMEGKFSGIKYGIEEERQRFLQLIEEFKQEGIIPLDERRQGWNQALEALKSKLL